MTRSVHDLTTTSSREINRLVTASVHGGSSLYELDEAALAAAEPDLILTQELCQVCAVSYREVNEVARAIDADITVVSLEPTSIEGILNTITTVGAMTEAEDAAVDLVESLRERLSAVEGKVQARRDAGGRSPRVVALEWLDPPFASGHWVPEQIRRAGGWELLGARWRPVASQTTWDAVIEVDPEMLLLMPCGFHLAETQAEWARTPRPAGYEDADGGPQRPGLRARRVVVLQPAGSAGASTASSCWPRSSTRRRSATSRRSGRGRRSSRDGRHRRQGRGRTDAVPSDVRLPVVRDGAHLSRPGRPRRLGAALPGLRRQGR